MMNVIMNQDHVAASHLTCDLKKENLSYELRMLVVICSLRPNTNAATCSSTKGRLAAKVGHQNPGAENLVGEEMALERAGEAAQKRTGLLGAGRLGFDMLRDLLHR